jgi:hypothetical protein
MAARCQLHPWWQWGQEMLQLQPTHPPLFIEAGESLEADHWLQVMESKFGLLRSTEVQKTLFAVQQLRGDASAWWANYTATRLADYQVSWAEFRDAFRTHYISTGVMRKKRQEFMDLKQGGRSGHTTPSN